MAGNLFFKTRRDTKFGEAEPNTTIQPTETAVCDDLSRVLRIPPSKIVANPDQPRKYFTDSALLTLADSIRQFGIIQPLTVRVLENSDVYELIAGERRLRAAVLIGLDTVPCVVIEADRRRSAEMAIIENIQREDLNMFEEGEALSTLISVHGLTQERVARRLSCSQSYVANKLRLLRLSPEERQIILEAGLTERHTRTLLRIKDTARRIAVMHTIIRQGMNVAAVEQYVDELLAAGDAPDDTTVKSPTDRRQKLIMKDIRLFYNTIDRAVSVIKQSGVPIEERRIETDLMTEIQISIPKKAV